MKKVFLAIVLIISSLSPGCISASEGKFTETTIDLGNATLFCRSTGQGAPLIVLHGGPGLTQDYLLPGLAKLSEEHFIIFYDQRGCGNSLGEVNPETINVETYISDLDAVRQHFGFEKVSILGHSWGGFLAMKYALTHPKSVDRLILSNSLPASSEEVALFLDEWARRLAPYQDEIQNIQHSKAFAEGDPETVERFYRIVFRTYCYLPEDADLLNLKMSPNAAVNGSKVNHILREEVLAQPFDLHETLTTLDVPALVIHGDSDPIPACTAESLHGSLIHSTYVLIDECGHFPYVEKPTAYFKHINAFMRRLPPS